MGLLDDAIREHLDLKRRRGADPADVERAEREALGPVRRAPTAKNLEVADEQHPDAGFSYDQEEEADWSGDPRDEPDAPASLRAPELAPDFGVESSFVEPEPQPEQRPSRLARIFRRTDREPEQEKPIGSESDREPLINPARTDRAASQPDPPTEPEPQRTPPPHAAGRSGELETTEYDLESEFERMDAAEEQKPTSDEDVLEETPEFLQDTPDHDRLWFEQRPPKDFDFDR
jgi:hypothetical protein